jgi:hypothetical protein
MKQTIPDFLKEHGCRGCAVAVQHLLEMQEEIQDT